MRSDHSIRQLRHSDRYFLFRPLYHRQYLPRRLARHATQLGSFIREDILRQLKQYGEPNITQEPTHYIIDGRPAAIILASVPMRATSGKVARTTYAAKACMLASIPIKARKKDSKPVEPVSRVFCFDFTTQNNELLNLMFSFIIQFNDDPLTPVFPASVIRRR